MVQDAKVNLAFKFDSTLDIEVNQADMYESVAQDNIEQFTQGFNCTIFAYGQTGSGKTFSMLGPEDVIDRI